MISFIFSSGFPFISVLTVAYFFGEASVVEEVEPEPKSPEPEPEPEPSS